MSDRDTAALRDSVIDQMQDERSLHTLLDTGTATLHCRCGWVGTETTMKRAYDQWLRHSEERVLARALAVTACTTCGGTGKRPLPDHMKQCTDECELPARCVVCGMWKSPRGRSVPLEAASGHCDGDCPGYNLEPKPPHLWPGELQREQEDPCPVCHGTPPRALRWASDYEQVGETDAYGRFQLRQVHPLVDAFVPVFVLTERNEQGGT